MSTHQVEEYYLHIARTFNADEKAKVEVVLCEHGYRRFEFEEMSLVVDEIEGQHEGDELEDAIMAVVNDD